MQVDCLAIIRNQQEFYKLWLLNKPALLNFMWQAHNGIKGIISDFDSKESIPNACMKIYKSSGFKSERLERNTCSGKNHQF